MQEITMEWTRSLLTLPFLFIIMLSILVVLTISTTQAEAHLQLDGVSMEQSTTMMRHPTGEYYVSTVQQYSDDINAVIWQGEPQKMQTFADVLYSSESDLYVSEGHPSKPNTEGISVNRLAMFDLTRHDYAVQLADLHFHPQQLTKRSLSSGFLQSQNSNDIIINLGQPIGPGNPIITPQYPNAQPTTPKPNLPGFVPSNEPRWEAIGTPIKGQNPVPAQMMGQQTPPTTGDITYSEDVITIQTEYGTIKIVPIRTPNSTPSSEPTQSEKDYDLSDDAYLNPELIPSGGDGEFAVRDGIPNLADGETDSPDMFDGIDDKYEAKMEQITEAIEAMKERYEALKEYLKEMFDVSDYDDKSLVETGDPHIVDRVNNTPTTIKREMGSHPSTYDNFNFYSSEDPIWLNAERDLGKNTEMLCIDFNENGKCETGYERLWHPDMTSYQILANFDYYQSDGDGHFDGKFDAKDPLWIKALIMNEFGDNSHPSELGFKSFGYSPSDYDIIEFEDDAYGMGQYVYTKYSGLPQTRALVYCENCVTMESGEILRSIGAVQAPLKDCTIHDVRYHIAELMTADYRDTGIDPRPFYQEALDYCLNFEMARANPDKYISHWYTGLASVDQKDATSDETKPTNMEFAFLAMANYKIGLKMNPTDPFSNVDYCLLQYQMSMPTNTCILEVEKAVFDRPDVEWFKEVLGHVKRGLV